MEIIAIVLFWITLYLVADVYYEKILESLKHPIATNRIKIDERNERRFRCTVFSPVVILLFFSAFRKMPELNFPYGIVWLVIIGWVSIAVVYFAVNTFFASMVNSFLKEKYEYRIQRKNTFRVSIIQTTLLIIVYVALRLMN